MNANKNSGFTLVELSIALVIIGLIVGGILVGKDLIHQAELRGVISEHEKILTAINTFKVTYNCIPGDCANATDFFGQAADCSAQLTETSGTCNGNGDGAICGDPFGCNNHAGQEIYFVSHHLHMAHLLDFPLTTPNAVTIVDQFALPTLQPGLNVFASKALSGMGWELRSILQSQVATAGFPHFCGSYPTDKNEIWFGGAGGDHVGLYNTSIIPYQKLMAVADAYWIDNKLDDGKPATGKIVSPYYAGNNGLWLNRSSSIACSTTTQTDPGAVYSLNVISWWDPGGNAQGDLVFLDNF